MTHDTVEQMDEIEIEFDREKFIDVVHYICHHCSPEELGRVKLHKILYFSDMLSYLDTGVPLTGAEYQKQGFGPTARPLKAALDNLERERRIQISVRDFYGYRKYDFVSLVEPATNRLSEDERRLVDKVIDFVCVRTASEISELSHSLPWQCADMGKRIPYFSAFGLLPAEITDEDLAWGEQEARRVLEST